MKLSLESSHSTHRPLKLSPLAIPPWWALLINLEGRVGAKFEKSFTCSKVYCLHRQKYLWVGIPLPFITVRKTLDICLSPFQLEVSWCTQKGLVKGHISRTNSFPSKDKSSNFILPFLNFCLSPTIPHSSSPSSKRSSCKPHQLAMFTVDFLDETEVLGNLG